MSHIRIVQSDENLFDPTTRQTIRDRLVAQLYTIRTSGRQDDQTVEDDRFLERMIAHLDDLGIDHVPDESELNERLAFAMERFPADDAFARGTVDADMTWNRLLLDAWSTWRGMEDDHA